MAIEEARLSDFSGGIRSQQAANETVDTQWLDLTGFVLDNERRLRTQWPVHTLTLPGAAPAEFGDGGGFVAGIVDATTGTAAVIGQDGTPGTFETWPLPVTGSDHAPLCRVPVLVGGVRETGLLFNSPSAASEPFVLYRTGGVWATRTFASTYPSGTPTADAMPRGAAVATTWADYLVLGDILWLDDQDAAFTAGNASRYVNRLWFSQPAQFDGWDPIDVELAGADSSTVGRNQIVGLFVVEQGLLVFDTSSIWLLRGTPNQHTKEELRRGMSPQDRRHVARWAATGGIVWVDQSGQVWQTNGELVIRLDRQIELGSGLAGAAPGDVSVAAAGDHLLVSSPTGCWAMTSYGPEGAWTRLAFPGAAEVSRWAGLFVVAGTLYAVSTETGWVRMLTSGDDVGRGTVDGVTPLTARLVSRVLVGEGHERLVWHRHGVRAEGSGSLVTAQSFPSPTAEGEHLDGEGLPMSLASRGDYVAPGHGPSLDATFAYEFEGDVAVGGVSVWFHQGTAHR